MVAVASPQSQYPTVLQALVILHSNLAKALPFTPLQVLMLNVMQKVKRSPSLRNNKANTVCVNIKGENEMSNANDFVINNGVLTKYTGNDTNIEIPEGVTTVYCDAFGTYNSSIEALHFPSTLRRPDVDNPNECLRLSTVFAALPGLKTITVSPENNFFKVCDGVLYSKDGKTLWRIPPKGGITDFTVPQTVQYIKPKAIPYINFVYFPQTFHVNLSIGKIQAPFFAPNMNFDKFDTDCKRLAVKGMAIAEYKGFKIDESLRCDYIFYITYQRKALIESGANPELIIFMAKENLLPKEMYDDCIEFFRKHNYIETVTVLLECKAKFFKPKDIEKALKKELEN